MENKPQSVFDKLDEQTEKIDDISAKLDGVSINDLYALAKRTMDYGDYDAAQKYYEHISLLKPLEWEAALYASLCNYNKSHRYADWPYILNKIKKVLISTIEYLTKLDNDEIIKNKDTSKCISIIIEEMQYLNDLYFRNKEGFDYYSDNFSSLLEELFISLYNTIKELQYEGVNEDLKHIVEICFGYISKTKEISSTLTKELFDEMSKKINESFDINYDAFYENTKLENMSAGKGLTEDEIKNIKLNGTLYYELNDRVLSQRRFRKLMAFGILFVMSSILGFVLSIYDTWFICLFFIPPLIYGIAIIAKALSQKNMINCYSLLLREQKRTRLSSKGNVVVETKLNFLAVILVISIVLRSMIGFLWRIVLFSETNGWLTLILAIWNGVAGALLAIYKSSVRDSMDDFEGKFKYLYNGQFYKFD